MFLLFNGLGGFLICTELSITSLLKLLLFTLFTTVAAAAGGGLAGGSRRTDEFECLFSIER